MASATFDDLKNAIDGVLKQYSVGPKSTDMQDIMIWDDKVAEKMNTLRAVYALYFVEPEDDPEFQNWRKS